jgi:hypothetical protein
MPGGLFMLAISLSLSRGVDGFKISDFTVGASAPGAGDIEVRYNVTDTNGKVLTKKDVILALKAFERATDDVQCSLT